MKDYYKILEVEENASDEDIKKSYRNLSKRFHPDVNPDGAEKFKEINEAYEVLGNGEKRQQYNQRKNNPYAGSDFENMFSQMFGGAANGFRQQQRRKSAPDKIVRVQISPVESVNPIHMKSKLTYPWVRTADSFLNSKMPVTSKTVNMGTYSFRLKSFLKMGLKR